MFGLRAWFYIVTVIITVISRASTSDEANDAVAFETQSAYSSGEEAKPLDYSAKKLSQNRETGFDVGFSGLDFEKSGENSQSVSSGIDSGFDGTRPGFSQGELGGHGIQPGYSQAFDPGFDRTRPGFSISQAEGHSAQPAYAQGVDPGFDGSRLGSAKGKTNYGGQFGFAQAAYPIFDEQRPALSVAGSFENYPFGNRPGYGGVPPQPGIYPGFEVGYNPNYDINRPEFSQGTDEVHPWPIRRYARQINNRKGSRYGQTVTPGFDSGFDGTRFNPNRRPSFDAGFDGTRPGFSQRPQIAFDKGFDGNRPGFTQNSRPSFDAGFDGTRPGFSQNLRPAFDGGFDGTRPGFAQRYPRKVSSNADVVNEQLLGSPLSNTRLRREIDSRVVDGGLVAPDIPAYQNQLRSEKFFLPCIKNLPFFSNCNYNPSGNPNQYGGGTYSNIGPYGSGGYRGYGQYN